MQIFTRLVRCAAMIALAMLWPSVVMSQGNALLSGKEAEVVALAQKLAAIDTRRREDSGQLDESRKSMNQAEQEMKAAKGDFSADGSELNARRVKNAEFAYMLKQREYNRIQEKLQNYDIATRQTQQKIAAIKVQVEAIKAGKVTPLATPGAQELSTTQQELEVAKARNEAAKQELTRLRAMMAQANNTPPAATPKPSPATAPSTASTTASAIKPIAEPAAEAPAHTSEATPVVMPNSTSSTALTADQKFAIGQYERIARMFREKGLDNAEGPDREMLIDAMVDFWIESKRTLKFGYLGHGQYIVETKLRNGDATFVVGEQRWKYTVPEQDDNLIYMFLLDTASNPMQLYYFRKDLLLVE